MKSKAIVKTLLSSVIIFASPIIFSEGVAQGDKVEIVTPETVARLCPYPSCGLNEHITRIPVGTALKVQGVQTVKSGILSAIWFEVTYKGHRGWVSIYDTNKQ